ncbi:MAG: ABC transporter ATP-binding protein [Syntrophobacteraceae bacterium]
MITAGENVLFDVRNLRVSFRVGNESFEAIQDLSLSIAPRSTVCFQGPSGSGKTTLLNSLGLIEPLQKGEIRYMEQGYRGLAEAEKNKLRKFNFGFIFQTFNLMSVLSAEENVEFFLARQGLSASERVNRVREALEQVALWEHRKKRPLEMSAGQRQRVAIARAIAKQPRVIFADEPTANLDQATGKGIVAILLALNRELGVSILCASHDKMVQDQFEKQIVLVDGRIQTPTRG